LKILVHFKNRMLGGRRRIHWASRARSPGLGLEPRISAYSPDYNG